MHGLRTLSELNKAAAGYKGSLPAPVPAPVVTPVPAPTQAK